MKRFRNRSVWSDILDMPYKEKPIIRKCPTCGKVLEYRSKEYLECPKCKRVWRL